MKFTPTKIPDVIVIKPDVFSDHRGFFMETWQARKFAEAGISATFVQDNHSRSFQGTLRGLHYQIQQAQGKLIRVTNGEVFDVVVDLRKTAPTFGKWVGEKLSSENMKMLWVPEGFAHGYYVISESADFFYKCTDYYAPEHERSIRWDDSDLSIAWPLTGVQPPVLAAKDATGMAFKDAEYFL